MTTGSGLRFEQRDWIIAAIIFAVALLARLVFLATSPDASWPHSVLFEGDALRWVKWAEALRDGQAYFDNLPMHPPAVAYVMHWLVPWSWADGSFAMTKAVWSLITAAGCGLSYLAVAVTVNRRVALVAAALLTFSFGSYILSSALNNEALYLPVLMLLVIATVRTVDTPRILAGTATGALHGVAMLVRPEHMLLAGLMGLYMLWRLGFARRELWKPQSKQQWNRMLQPAVVLVMVAFTSILVCLPWSMQSSRALQQMNQQTPEPIEYDAARVTWTEDAQQFMALLPGFSRYSLFQTVDRTMEQAGIETVTQDSLIRYLMQVWGYVPEPLPNWSFLSIKGGMDFALANHPAARDGYDESLVTERIDLESSAGISRPDLLQLRNEGYQIGWGYITHDFSDWLVRVGLKLVRFHDGISYGFTAGNLPLGWRGERRPVDMFTATGRDSAAGQFSTNSWRVVVLALVCSGAWLACRRRVAGIWLMIIVYKVIVTIFFYGYARQSVSIAPAFFVLMALPLVQLAQPLVARLGRKARPLLLFGVLGVILVDILLAVNRPPLRISGESKPLERWGDSAFTAPGHLKIVPRPREH